MAARSPAHENLQQDFYVKWMNEYESQICQLQEALEKMTAIDHPPESESAELERKIERLVQHHRDYYRAKERATSQNVLETMLPEWRTRLEKVFMWLGGWRPSMAFQLVYGLAGKHIEEELVTILHGMDTLSFASLSASQLSDFSRLQTLTTRLEDMLGHELAILQQSFADEPLLTLAQVNEVLDPKSKLWDSDDDCICHHHADGSREQEHHHHCHTRNNCGNEVDRPQGEHGAERHDTEEKHQRKENSNERPDKKRLNSNRQEVSDEDDEPRKNRTQHENDAKNSGMGLAMLQKLASLKDIFSQADSLRLETLESVLHILNPVQKAVYLIAAFKLQAAVKTIGEKLNDGFINSSAAA